MINALVALALAASPGAPSSAPAAPPRVDPAAVLLQPEPERRAALAALSPEQKQQLADAVTPEVLAALGERSLAALGTYAVQFETQERVNGVLLAPKGLDVTVQPSPLALRIDYLTGPGKGRRVLYNRAVRPDAVRVRDAGMTGLLGALWLSLDAAVTRRDTNHPATDIGFGTVVRNLRHDAKVLPKLPGASFATSPFTPEGLLCTHLVAPAGSPVYAEDLKLCFDLGLGLPVLVETTGPEGLRERFRFSDVRPRLHPADDFFTLEGAGL
jgi:hypothetical protein